MPSPHTITADYTDGGRLAVGNSVARVVKRRPARQAGAMEVVKTLGLFVLTAIAEIVGCYLPYLWLRQGKPIWLLAPAALSLAAFAYLLTLHPTGAGRTYAAYGGVYVAMALLWMWAIESQSPDRWDLIGGAVALTGMAIIVFGPRGG